MRAQNYITVILGGIILLASSNASAWTVSEDYDAQGLNERCAPFWDDGADSKVSNEQSISGNKSCRMAVPSGGKTWGGGFVSPSFLHKGDEAWIRFRLYLPLDFDYGAYSAGNKLKFIRMTVRDTSNDSIVGRLDWYWHREGSTSKFGKILERDKCTTDCWETFGGANAEQVRGVWETYEMYAKFDHVSVNDGGEGRVRVWKNGILMADLTDRPTMWPGSDEVSSMMIFSHWNGGSPKAQHLYFEDLIATNEVPGSSDAAGNPYIGVGSYVYVAPPKPPANVR